MAVAAVALVLIGFSQTAGDARAFAAKHRYQIDIDQESVAQAVANIGAGLFQGMPVSTSLSASSLNDHSGARTGLASHHVRRHGAADAAGAGAAVLRPAQAGPGGADHRGRRDGHDGRARDAAAGPRASAFDFWIAVAAIVGTLVFGVLAGVMIGIALSLLWLISVATRPDIPVLGREPGTQVFRDLDEHPDDELVPGVVVIRMDGGLFFATSDALEDRVRERHPRRRRD